VNPASFADYKEEQGFQEKKEALHSHDAESKSQLVKAA
jgi:hypothetical protein